MMVDKWIITRDELDEIITLTEDMVLCDTKEELLTIAQKRMVITQRVMKRVVE
jgi:hypothetical protein